ncbi:hypothetical protein MANES_07G007551v8 [Manihot esculenta]|uniref:Uncharacterized protein n=1 Tax=Manihot esculenta TaxID=3983 RepID=A0ACB7HBI7_MANES|nr:hypothetical protein MANES_07G007551v8 [Manihot esculenta]
MSTEKEQNQTNENQFRLQKYVWWPWSTNVRVIAIAIVTLAFFLGTTIKIERHLVGGKKQGDNIQWLVDWMKSPESQNKSMNLRCKKVNDELRCTREPEEGNGHAENSKQSQRFFLRLDGLKGDQTQSENSLCCRPCRHSSGKVFIYRIEFNLERYKKIYYWLLEIIKKGNGDITVDCNYHSVTLSTKFEYELKRMLEYELQLLQKNTVFQTSSTECKTDFFKTKFGDILSKTLEEVSLKKPTHSTEEVIFTSQVEQREEQVVYAQKYSTTTSTE